jgi:hypothetical protein
MKFGKTIFPKTRYYRELCVLLKLRLSINSCYFWALKNKHKQLLQRYLKFRKMLRRKVNRLEGIKTEKLNVSLAYPVGTKYFMRLPKSFIFILIAIH